jgi:hypothetical protein
MAVPKTTTGSYPELGGVPPCCEGDVGFPRHGIPTATLLAQAREMCAAMLDEKDAVGRNEFMEILETFPHGIQDISFMLYDKSTRILGAEKKIARLPKSIDSEDERIVAVNDILDNLIDTVNYGLFGIMIILSERRGEKEEGLG